MLNKFAFILLMLHSFQSYEAFKRCETIDKQKLVIDQDGGADDAMAIFMALLYEKHFAGPEIVALTTTFGNVDEHQAYNNTQRILDIAGRRDIKIYRGSNRSLVIKYETDYFFGLDGLGDNDTAIFKPTSAETMHAVLALIDLSKKYQDKLTVMSIGPLTNIALAIRLDPGFLGRISHLYVGAGRIPDETNQFPEFNALMDVEAYRIVAESSTPDKVTMIAFSVVESYLNVSKEWREDILGSIPTNIMSALNVFEQVALTKIDSWAMLDPAAAAIVLDKEVVEEVKLTKNDIVLCDPGRGVNTNDFASAEPNVQFVYSLKEDYYKNLLLKIFSAELN